MRISDLSDIYLDHLKNIKRYSDNTVKSYSEDINTFIEFCSEKNIQEVEYITEKVIKFFLIYLNAKKLNSKSIIRSLSSLRGLFKFAYKKNILQANPLEYISNPKSMRKLPEVLNLDAFLRIYKIAGEEDKDPFLVKAIFELMYGCALRVSEVCNMKLGDIDFDRKSIRILGKGNKTRFVPLGSKSEGILQNYLASRDKIKISDKFLKTKKGDGVNSKLAYRIVHKYLSKVSDIKKKSPHILRHSAATHMLDNGADLRAVKEILGHENLSTTQIYTHVSVERLKNIYKKSHPKS